MANPLDFLLGTGLLAGSVATDKEPGEVVQARQFLRNQFTSPTALSEGLSQQVQGLGQHYEPLLRQQENQVLDQTQERILKGRPTSLSTAMGGPEISGLRKASEDVLIPRRQALYGELGTNALKMQTDAARYILQNQGGDATSEALGKLAALLMSNGGNGGSTGLLGGLAQSAGTGITKGIWDLITGGGTAAQIGSNAGSILPAVAGGVGGLTQSLWSSLFGAGGAGAGAAQAIRPMAAAETAKAIQLLTSMGVPAEQAAAIVAEQGAAGGLGAAGAGTTSGTTPAGGLMSGFTMQGLMGALASAAAGGGAGYMIGKQLPGTQIGATAAGAAGGAAAGAATGALMGMVADGPGVVIGAIIGGLAGAGGGFMGSRGASHAIKAKALASDQLSQKTTTSSMASFWTAALGEAGYEDLDGWGTFAQSQIDNVNAPATAVSYGGFRGTYDQQDAIAAIGANLLLQKIQKTSPQITSLDAIGPEFRAAYIDFIMSSTMIEKEGKVVPTENIDQQGSLLRAAGIDSASGPGTLNPTGNPNLNVNQYGEINQQFANVDRATSAEINSLVSKLRSSGYSGPIPSGITAGGGGRVPVQIANFLIRGVNKGLTPDQTFSEFGIQR